MRNDRSGAVPSSGGSRDPRRAIESLGQFCEELASLSRGGSPIDPEVLARCEGVDPAAIARLAAGLDLLGAVLGGEEDPTRPQGGLEGADSLALGRYVDAVQIARGGMGAVLRAEDPDLERTVAIKVQLAGRRARPESVTRFLREARITGQLEHPNIPPVHELAKTPDGRWYFSMKLVEGRTLAEELRRRGELPRSRRPEATLRLLGVILKVCDALRYAHSRGVFHRDLKPANIMIGEFGEVLVMDWGIAKVRGDRSTRIARPRPADAHDTDAILTQAGDVLGTPAYMSPEQSAGEQAWIDARSDVYTLGVILYEIVTGSLPYAGVTFQEMRSLVCIGRPELPSRRAPDERIPRELDAAILRAMAVEPEDRYQRVEDLQADLEAYLQGNTLRAARYTLLERALKWVRRNRAVSAVATVATVGLLVLSAAFVWRLDAERQRAEDRADAEEALRREAERRADRDGDLVAMRYLLTEFERDLWPVLPERIDRMSAWLRRARALAERQAGYQAAWEALAGAREEADDDPMAVPVLEELRSGLTTLGESMVPAVEERLHQARRVVGLIEIPALK